MSPKAHILVVSPDRISDAIMAMPAVQAYAAHYPDHIITVLARSSSWPFWHLHPIPAEVVLEEPFWGGLRRTEERVQVAGPYDRAYIMPRSFLSAWVTWRCGIPERYGLPGHLRALLMTGIVEPASRAGREHRAFEYLDLMLPDKGLSSWEPPQLQPDPESHKWMCTQMEKMPRPWITLVPGAEGGPAKQWPASHFVALGQRLAAEKKATIWITGNEHQRTLCNGIAAAIGTAAHNLAGELDTPSWASALALSDVVVTNENGALQIAAAFDTPIVALFGITDPLITGPLTRKATILQAPSVRTQPDVPRHSAAAEAALAALTPEQAYAAVRDWLNL